MMAAAFDVAGRLSEGDRALTVLDEYVAACQVLGVASPGPLAELYRAESGLDLDALAADARSLDAAVVAAQDALRLQGNGYRELTAQWSGTGGGAAGGFLRSLTVAAEDVVTHLQRSAQALTTLRDELWRAVDAKVDAVLRTEARAAGHRDQWSAASRAVLAGAGDMSAASEIVDQQVKPFILGAVSGDLMPALQDAADTVAAAYDSAVAAVTPAGLSFPVPVVLSPEWAPQAPPLPAAAHQAAPAASFGALGAAAGWTPSASSVPAEPVATPSAPPASAGPTPAPPAGAPGLPDPALGTAAATPAAAGLPGDPGSGSGVGGLGQQLTDAIGGALGSMAGLAPGASGLGGLDNIRDGLGDDLGIGAEPDDELDDDPDGEPDDSEAEDGDDKHADDKDADESDADEEDAIESDAAESEDAGAGPVDGPEQPTQQPVPAPPVTDPAPTTPPVEPVAEQPDPTTKTPCEIAADELPNVGE